MFSIREEQKSEGDQKTLRNRNLEAMVRFTHENMVHQMSAPISGEAPGNASLETGQDWNDIVFQNRNQEYGAYVLRKGYSYNVFIGLIVTLLAVIFLILYPFISRFLFGTDIVHAAPPRKLVYTELSAPPPIDKPKPPPPQVQLPRLQKTIKFVPPKVVKEEVQEVPPTIAEIKENVTASVNVEGPSEVIFEEPVEEIIVEDDNQLFTVVDQQPEFEGGYDAMMAFIKQNMKYPANARRMQIEGTVHVSFIVSKTGSISEVKVMRGFMTECDREAIRVVQLMPAWRPGKQNGRNVNVRFILPLKFRLN